jgi:hypothetical protein
MRFAILVWEEEKVPFVLKGFAMDQEALDTMIEEENLREIVNCYHWLITKEWTTYIKAGDWVS